VSIFCGVCLPLIIFFVPETAYRRSDYLNTDMASSEDVRVYDKRAETGQAMGEPRAESVTPDASHTPEQPATRPVNENGINPNIRKHTYWETLAPFNGLKTDENFFKLLFRPFPLFAHPAILWGCLIQGTLIGWTVFIGIILAAIFLGPPLFWSEVETGYAYTGAFIGAVLGFLVAGGLADWSAKFMTRRNHGIYEPEFRIVLVIPQLIFGCAGLYGFGVTSASLVNYTWFLPVFFFALEVMAMVIGAVASSLYIVDAHRDIAIEAFTCLLIFKNFFSFGLTFSAYGWVVHFGTFNTFMVIASIQVVICLLSIPMYIFGKRNRSFFHRHNILKLTHLY